MIARLLVDGNIITEKITDYLSYKEIEKIRNKLIDGTYHIQTIGDSPLKIAQLTCILNPTGKALFEDAYVIDEPMRFEYEGNYYQGLLLDKPKWKGISINLQDNSKLYEVSFDFVVSEEGVI